jgi:hypothetical protein
MANDEHVAMLAHGAEVWNEWRAERDEPADLSRARRNGAPHRFGKLGRRLGRHLQEPQQESITALVSSLP